MKAPGGLKEAVFLVVENIRSQVVVYAENRHAQTSYNGRYDSRRCNSCFLEWLKRNKIKSKFHFMLYEGGGKW